MKRSEGLHVFCPDHLEPIYSAFEKETSTSLTQRCQNHVKYSYREIADEIRGFRGPFIADISLPTAVQLAGESRGSADQIVIIGAITSFAQHAHITMLYYPQGKLEQVQHFETPDTFSIANWLALMLLKSADAPLMKDPSTLVARVRVSDDRAMFVYAIRSLEAQIPPLLEAFLVVGWPEQFRKLKGLTNIGFDCTELFDWYMEKVSWFGTVSPRPSFNIRVAVARRRDVEKHRKAYQAYLGRWRAWKSSATKPGEKFWMLSPETTLNDTEINLACEFFGKAKELLGTEILDQVGARPDISLVKKDDFLLVCAGGVPDKEEDLGDMHPPSVGRETVRETEGVHIFYQGAEPVYSRFKQETPASSVLKTVYHKEQGYAEIGDKIAGFEGAFLAEVSLGMAADLAAEYRGTANEMVIIGTLTSFRRGTEMTALYYPEGKLKGVQYIEAAGPLSLATWLALMFLKSMGASVMRAPSAIRARMRTSEYKETYDYVLRALRAGVTPLLDSFLVAAWPKEFDELKALTKGKFEYTEVYDWYWEKVSRLAPVDEAVPLLSKVLVARRRDIEKRLQIYEDYLGEWKTWKSSVTKPGQRFHMLFPRVDLDEAEMGLACEFINKAKKTLGPEVLEQIGVRPDITLDREGDFLAI